mgnify:CR=1 FL=1
MLEKSIKKKKKNRIQQQKNNNLNTSIHCFYTMSVVDGLGDWLDLTDRELEILKIIHHLDSAGDATSPESIVNEFKRSYGKRLQKPNLFHLLKKLRQQKYVKKTGYGKYKLDLEEINSQLEEKTDSLDEDRRNLDKFRDNLRESLHQMTWDLATPEVEYMDYETLYSHLAKMAEQADTISIVASFPQITYSRELSTGLNRENYLDTLYKNAVKKDKLHLEYLTDLDVDYLFNHCFRVHEDPAKAFQEAQNTVNKLELLTQKNPNIDIRFQQDPHGLDVIIRTNQKTPREFALLVQDEHQDTMAGINIKHTKTSQNSHQTFNRTYQYSLKLSTPAGQRKIQETKKSLTKKYGILNK